MKNTNKLLTILAALFLVTACYGGKQINNQPSLASMLKKVMPTVVNITIRGETYVNPTKKNTNIPPRFEQQGSGVIIDEKNGYIVTNAHVIKNADSITVTLSDARSMIAKIIGYDIPSDIAVLQVKTKRLKSIKFGDSDKLKVGDFVSAIGSPFGLQQTVTSGIVSALERNLGQKYDSFIQTDAPINTGNSGGALVDMQGELIGINTALIAPIPISAGIGLAVPSNITKNVTEQLIKNGRVKRGIIGLSGQDITPALREAMDLKNVQEAFLVSEVMPGGPAAQAGIKSKDVIVKIMDKPVHSATQINNITSLMPIGSKVKLQILRDNKYLNLALKIMDPETLMKTVFNAPKVPLSGLELTNFHQLIDNALVKGIKVVKINDASVAYSCGLRPGDIIIEADKQPVTSLKELQTIANKNPNQLLLEVKRGLGGKFLLVIEE